MDRMGSGRPLAGVVTLGLIMTICCPCRGQSQDSRVIPMKKVALPINALLGHNVTIPCVAEPDLDLPEVSVLWGKILKNGSDSDVYRWPDPQGTPMRPGSGVDEGELRRGNASLTLYHVHGSDEGNYTCTIFGQSKIGLSEVKLQVFAPPDVKLSTSKITAELDQEKSVTCEVAMFYPKEVTVQWKIYQRGDVFDRETYLSEPKENSDGSFNVSSQLVVTPSSREENGDVYSCVVKYESLNHEWNDNFTLTVSDPPNWFSVITLNLLVVVVIFGWFVLKHILTVPPQISDIVGLDDLVYMKTSLLAFMVSGFKPKDIEIHLYIKGDNYREKLKSWKYPAPQRVQKDDLQELKLENEIEPLRLKKSYITYSCLCSTHITPDKRFEGAELIIEVIHKAGKDHYTERLKIREEESIPSMFVKRQAGQEMQISNRMHSYHPIPTTE